MTARIRLRPTALLLALALLLPACGDDPAGGKSGASRGGASDVRPSVSERAEDPWKDAPATRLRFTDVSAQGGISAVNHSGRPGLKEWLLEAVAPGAAWFDFDSDGLLDLFIPDGDILDNYDLVMAQDPRTGRPRPTLQPHAVRKRVFLDTLWRNNGDGTFTEMAEAAGIRDERWSFGATPFDVDGDGDQDLFVCNFGPNRLWRNNGDGTFTDIAEQVGVAGNRWDWDTAAAVGDLDGDGRLDIYLAAYADPASEVERLRIKHKLARGIPVQAITGRACTWKGVPAYCGPVGLKGAHDTVFRQGEDGRFHDVTDAWGVRPRVARYAFTCLMFDFNGDGLQDVYVADDSEENFMWQQARDPKGRIFFRDTSDVLAIKVGTGVTAQACMGMTAADVNGDLLLDIFVTNFAYDYNNLYIARKAKGSGTMYFKDHGLQVMGEEVFNDLSWGCGWYDFDNDGDLDLYVANGHVYKEIDLFEKTGCRFDQLNTLFETMDPAGLGFREVGTKAQRAARSGVDTSKLFAGDGMAVEYCSRQAAFCDWNNDGRMDVLVMNMNREPTLLLNTSVDDGHSHWIKLSLRQPGGNREALGAGYLVEAGDLRVRGVVIRQKSFLGCDDPRQHVGVGPAETCDVTVTWPGAERATTTFVGLRVGAHWLLDRETGKATEIPLRAFEVK